MFIKNLKIKGFKNAVEEKIFDFSEDYSLYEGENGTGKTTIGEAIVWGFLGTNLEGSNKCSNLLNGKVTEIEIDFNHLGDSYNLIRRKKGSKVDIYLNGEKIKQTDLTSFFPDSKTFLAVFNPVFVAQMSPKDAKDFFVKILPMVTNEDVFAEMNDSLVKMLIDNNFKNPNLFMEQQREELKSAKENLIYLEGIVDASKDYTEIPDKLELQDKEKLEQLEQQYEELINKRIEPIHDLKELALKEIEIKSNIAKIQSTKAPDKIDASELVEEALKIKTKLNTPIPEPPTKDVTELMYQKSKLITNYKKIKQQMKEVKSDTITCNKCGNEIMNVKQLQFLDSQLEDIEKEGKRVSSQLEKIQEENELARKKYEKDKKHHKELYQDKYDKIQHQLNRINEKNSQLEAQHQKKIEKEVAVWNEELKLLDIENKKNENRQHEENCKKNLQVKINQIKEEIENIKEIQKDIIEHNIKVDMMIKNKEKSKKEIESALNERVETENKINQIKSLINIAKDFISKKLDLQSENINQHLDKVKIQLYSIYKTTGEIKDTFKIIYDGKEFNVLSNSESIKAGLELSNLIMNSIGVKYPIFVDNAESITSYNKPDTQIIECRVAKCELQRVDVKEELAC